VGNYCRTSSGRIRKAMFARLTNGPRVLFAGPTWMQSSSGLRWNRLVEAWLYRKSEGGWPTEADGTGMGAFAYARTAPEGEEILRGLPTG